MAKSAIDPVWDKAGRTVSSARATARQARDMFEEGRSALPDIARSAQKAFSDGVDQWRGQVEDVAGDAGEQFDSARLYMVERVQERPLTATLAALAAGFVLGMLVIGGRR